MTTMLTAKQLQDLLHVDRSTVYRMAEDGRLPALKVGRQWRFPADRVEDWLDEHGVPGVAGVRADSAETDLADALPLTCAQHLQDTFAELLGVMVLITDMAGNPVTTVSAPCGLYEATLPHSLDRCREQWHALAQSIELKPKFTLSHLGLLCIRGLIREGSRLRGVVVLGGIAPEAWPPAADEIARLAAGLGVTEAVFRQHMHEVYVLDSAEKARVQANAQRIADVFSHILNERKQLAAQL